MIAAVFHLLVLWVTASAASPFNIESRDLQGFVYNATHPTRGNGTWSDEIKCYSLPYGGLGIVSHSLTYWTIGMLLYGRTPFCPCRGLSSHAWDAVVSTASLVGSLVLSALTMASCRNSWQFVLIAFWKLTLGLAVGTLGIIAPFCDASEGISIGSVVVAPYYTFGTVIGSVGLFSLVHETISYISAVRKLVFALVGCVAFAVGLGVVITLLSCCCGWSAAEHGFRYFTGLWLTFLISLVFFSDLILAAVADNWAGVPDNDNKVIYWLYFASKRLPMLEF